MRYKLFEIEPGDVDEIEAKQCYSVGELGCSKDLIHLSKMTEDSIALGFGEGEGLLHGVAGSYRQWAGSAQLWAIFSHDSEKFPIALAKVCDALILYAARKQGLQRVSLNVRSDYDKGNKFAKFLKFDLEGKMRRYLPDGADANIYARLF